MDRLITVVVRGLIAAAILIPTTLIAIYAANWVRLSVYKKTGWQPKGNYTSWLWNRVLVVLFLCLQLLAFGAAATLLQGRRLW